MFLNTIFTTNIEFKKNRGLKKFIFAGDWCIKDKKSFEFCKKSFPNIWDSTKEIDKDYKFLKKIHAKVNKQLSNYLYLFHKKKLSRRIWYNLLFIWLTYYLFFYYFKWKTISLVFKKYKKLDFINYEISSKFFYLDSLDFYNKSSDSDILNYEAFKKIILFQKKKKLINVKISKKKEVLKIKKEKNKKIVKKNIIESFISYIQKKIFNPKILVIDGVNFKFNFFLSLLSFQFPLTYKNIFDWENEKRRMKIKKGFKMQKKINTKKGSYFEKFIFENILNDLPICFSSSFDELEKKVNKIKFNPKIIISGTQHVHNEIAKLWLLKQKYNLNKKLFIVSHGGGHQKLSLTMYDYEHKIGNYFFQWLDKKKFLNYRFPNTKYSFKNIKRNFNAKKIIFVGNELKSYINRISPGPMSINSSKTVEDLEKIIKNLKRKIRINVYYSPKKELIRYFKNKLLKLVSRKKILPTSTLDKNMKDAKLIICSYPQTTFFDSLMSGPTILVYNPNQWRHYRKLDKAYKLLKKKRIIFDNPNAAAKHINEVWDRIDEWWNKEDVSKARDLFLKEFNLPPKNKISDVFKCLKILKNV